MREKNGKYQAMIIQAALKVQILQNRRFTFFDKIMLISSCGLS